jgi:hypothetical protein
MTRAFTLVVLAYAVIAHAETAPRFAWHVPLVTDAEHAFQRVELPAVVYEGVVRSDLGDVRIRNADGEDVPFAILPPPTPTRERPTDVDLAMFPLRVGDGVRDLGDLSLTVRRDGGRTQIEARTRDGAPTTGPRLAGYLVDTGERHDPFAALRVQTVARSGVDVRVRIEGSDDLATWRALVAGAPLLALDYAGRQLVRDRVDLPAAAPRYLRLAFIGPIAPELASVRGEIASRVVEPARQSRKAAARVDPAQPTEYAFDLGGPFPVDRLTLELPEVNSVAPAQVFAAPSAKAQAPARDAWQGVATTVFYRLRQADADTVNPPVAIPPTAARHWKVRIDPSAGTQAGKAPILSVEYLPRTLVFAARGKPPFALVYASGQASPAALPIATLVPGFDARTSPASFGVASVGKATAPPTLDALRTPPDVKRWLLWATLAGAAVVLAWMAFRLMRQMRAAPTSEDAPRPPV